METVNTSENIKEVVFNGVKYRLMGKKRYYLASHSASQDRKEGAGTGQAVLQLIQQGNEDNNECKFGNGKCCLSLRLGESVPESL